jgi:hypothetical protein
MLQEINQRLESAESSLGSGGGSSLAADVFTSAGVTGGPQVTDLRTLYPNAGENKIDPQLPGMRPGNIPGTNAPYSSLRGGISEERMNSLNRSVIGNGFYDLNKGLNNLQPLSDNQLNVDPMLSPIQQSVGMANGGRIGYDGGTNPKKDFLIKKGYGDMVKNMSVIEIDQLFNSVKGTTTAANTYREPAYMGGRMGYADGPKDPTYTGNNMEDLPRGLQIDTTTFNPIPNDAPQKEISDVAKIMLGPGRSGIGEPEDGTMKGYQFFRTQYLPKKVKEISENYGIEESDVLRLIREEMMNYIDTPKSLEKPKMANGGRINRAYGSDDLVEQASGIEGLDININPKGVKELDLRETGGFIPPVGVKEKADDIPAMLSNNEFVFTADAVRAAGGGSVNKGAQIMYDTMKKLENGGTV